MSWVAQTGETLVVPNTAEDRRFTPGLNSPVQSVTDRSMVLTPLWAEGKVIGVISAAADGEMAFDDRNACFFETLAMQAGVVIQQERQRRRRIEAIRLRYNPYQVGEPIRNPDSFFGRKNEIQQILDGIAKNSFIVHGERRIGKTSLLYQLEHHLSVTLRENPTHVFIPVLTTLQGVAEQEFFGMLMGRDSFHLGCTERN